MPPVVQEQPVRMAAVPVTVEQYAAFDPEHVPYFRDRVPEQELPTHPVVEVTWFGAAAYCDWLSLKVGLPRAYDHADWVDARLRF